MHGLNPPQREAVLTTEGPVLMLAGAGTGKTRALTSRLAHIIFTQRAWPSEILAVTFTNKAAREMRERMRAMIGDSVEGLSFLGTFHSIGARMLRRHAGLAGLEAQLHHPRYRRSAAPAEAGYHRRRSRREALACEAARRAGRPVEEQGLEPGTSCPRMKSSPLQTVRAAIFTPHIRRGCAN